MIEVHRSEDCGNSPKNLFVQELSIALALGEIDSILGAVSDDVRWDIVGHRQVRGRIALAEKARAQETAEVETVTIHHVVTHGKAGAVNGTIELADGRSRQFCDVHEFTNAKGTSVRAVTSYIIESNC